MKALPRAVRPLSLKVMYRATELAESIGISRHMLDELVSKRGLLVYTLGRATLIPLSEIKDKLEPVWDAICLAEQVRGDALARRPADGRK